jgi:hypothetical protein
MSNWRRHIEFEIKEKEMPAILVANAQTIYAAFNKDSQASKAVAALMDNGIRAEDISIISPRGTKAYYNDTADESEASDRATSGLTTTTGADASVGAEKGAGLGLGVGVVAALACLMVPGFGLVVGGGALATAIAGAAGATAAGAVAGGVHGYLRDQGVPDDAIGSYGQDYDSGDTLVAVTAPSDGVNVMTAHEILSKYNGKHINAY